MQIRAVHLTTNNVSVSQVLSDLLNQIPFNEPIDSVYTVGTNDTKLYRQVISGRHIHAVIPPRKKQGHKKIRNWDLKREMNY